MKLFLIRHGKSDKRLKTTLSHDEFELQRELLAGETKKTIQLGRSIQAKSGQIDPQKVDLVFSGKIRSKQTAEAIGAGLGLRQQQIQENLREDFGLVYLASEEYWGDCTSAVQTGTVTSHAEFFLKNSPDSSLTFSADYIRKSMRQVIRRAIDRNRFLKKEVSVMVSHEPVISLCLSDLFELSVEDLGGGCRELEYAEFDIRVDGERIEPNLSYRSHSKNIKNILHYSQ